MIKKPLDTLRNKRLTIGLSREELSKETGISAQAIYRIERGETDLMKTGVGQIRPLINRLGLSLDDVTAEYDIRNQVAEFMERLLQHDPIPDLGIASEDAELYRELGTLYTQQIARGPQAGIVMPLPRILKKMDADGKTNETSVKRLCRILDSSDNAELVKIVPFVKQAWREGYKVDIPKLLGDMLMLKQDNIVLTSSIRMGWSRDRYWKGNAD